jgi:predicted transcriptional regulator
MTITIRLSDELEEELRAELDARGVKLSEFVREAIAEKLDREASRHSSFNEESQQFFGRHGSGRDDLSTNRKAILDELLRAKHSR